jgi:colanic acid/amylovoran biosynthesis glycosyltransferase
MRKVLVFKESLLPPSKTFILAQMNALSEYAPILAGLERAHPSLALPQEPLLLSRRGRSISDARAKLYRRTGAAPLFHSKAKRARPDLVHAHFGSGGRTALRLARAACAVGGHDPRQRCDCSWEAARSLPALARWSISWIPKGQE